MSKQSSLVIYILSLLFIAGAAYAIGRVTVTPKVEVIPQATATQTVKVRDASDATALTKALSEIEALKAENMRLKKSQEERQAAAQSGDAAARPEEVVQPPRRMTWRERMEELKEKDPERYAQEVERRENFVKMIEQRRTERLNFLDSIDTSLLSSEAQQVHERFATAIERQGELQNEFMALMESGEPPSEELRNEMHTVMSEIRETREAERVALLNAIGTSMGLDSNDLSDFTELVTEVFNATSNHMRPMPPRNAPPPQQPGEQSAPNGQR